jgi:hypothetical protein
MKMQSYRNLKVCKNDIQLFLFTYRIYTLFLVIISILFQFFRIIILFELLFKLFVGLFSK